MEGHARRKCPLRHHYSSISLIGSYIALKGSLSTQFHSFLHISSGFGIGVSGTWSLWLFCDTAENRTSHVKCFSGWNNRSRALYFRMIGDKGLIYDMPPSFTRLKQCLLFNWRNTVKKWHINAMTSNRSFPVWGPPITINPTVLDGENS